MVTIKTLKQKFNNLKQFIVQNVIEILFILGLFFIDAATFILNSIAGLYSTGVILIILSIILLKPPMKRR